MNNTQDVELRIRARNEVRGTVSELTAQLKDLGKTQAKQLADAGKGTADVRELDGTYRKYESTLKAVLAVLRETHRHQQQDAALTKTAERLDAARRRQDAFTAALAKGGELTARQTREQARLAGAVEHATAAVAKAQARVDATAARLRAYGIATSDIADAQSRMRSMILSGNDALRLQEQAIERAGVAQKRMAGGDVHAALERFRSTVLGLAAAYVSVQQAAGLARDSVDAFSSREGVKNQLALSVGNDRAAIDSEYAYVKAQADRIGIEFDRAAKAYAKFSAAATMAGRARDEIRFIWESFAEVGRVANLSTEELDGTFKVLEQVISKGKIQAEELRGQLGDRLFGAFQVAAKALKDQFPDLDKAMQNGLVTSEQLVAVAAEYRRTVADQLPAATKGLAAEQARFNNTVRDFQLAIADAGWADAYRAALVEITAALKSDDGKRLAEGLAAAFSAAADAAVWLVKHANEVLLVLKALSGLWAINTAGKATQGVLDYAGALKAMAADAKTAIKELGLLRSAFALLQAAFVGWSIGTWAREFEVVRKAGVALVTGLNETWTRIKAGAQMLFEELPRYAKNAFAGILNAVTWGVRKTLEVMQAGFRAIGRDDLADNVGRMVDRLTAKYAAQGDRVAEIRRQMERDIQGIRDIGMQMWTDAERRPATTGAPAAAAPTARPATQPGKQAGPSAADIAKRQGLVDEITRALEALDVKLDRAQTDSLRGQLDAIDGHYAALSRKIAAVGGETGAEFMRRLDAALQQLRAQTIAKFNAGMADERAALLAKLDALDAAAGRKSKTDLDARLAAIRTSYEATYREIDAFRAKLEANGRSTGDADAARARLDAGIAELQQIETQKFRRDELKRLEGGINDLLATRSDRLKTIADQEAAGLITSAQARTQMADAIAALQPQIDGAADAAAAFADSLRGAFDPVALDAFIARLELVKNSGAALTREFQLTGKQVDEMIANRSVQAFDAVAKSIGGVIAGQESWSEAIAGTGAAFMQFAADVLREIAMMIVKQMVLNALQSTGWGGAVAEGVSAAVKHDGGVVTAGAGRMRTVSPRVFMSAPKYHTGGIAGLAPGEIPAILQRNEEVLTTDDPRHIVNGGKGQGGSSARFVLVDDRSKVAEAMAGAEGEQVTMVHLRRNIPTLRQMLG